MSNHETVADGAIRIHPVFYKQRRDILWHILSFIVLGGVGWFFGLTLNSPTWTQFVGSAVLFLGLSYAFAWGQFRQVFGEVMWKLEHEDLIWARSLWNDLFLRNFAFSLGIFTLTPGWWESAIITLATALLMMGLYLKNIADARD